MGTRYDSYSEAVLGTVLEYFSLPIRSFCQLINSSYLQFTNGQFSFRPIVNILARIGVFQRVDIKQEIVGGADSNVYTMFGTMYRDFGFGGILLISMVYGILCGSIYRRRHSGKLKNIYFNAVVCMVLAFGYYDFKFIQTIYLFSLIYVLLIEKLIKTKLYIGNEDIYDIKKKKYRTVKFRWN